MKEMVKSHTAETAALLEEFKREMERKLVKQKEDMKVLKTASQHCTHVNFKDHIFMHDFILENEQKFLFQLWLV